MKKGLRARGEGRVVGAPFARDVDPQRAARGGFEGVLRHPNINGS